MAVPAEESKSKEDDNVVCMEILKPLITLLPASKNSLHPCRMEEMADKNHSVVEAHASASLLLNRPLSLHM